MNVVNRSVFLNTGIANPPQYVAHPNHIQRSNAHLKNGMHTVQQNLIDDQFSRFQVATETESSEQYLWSAAWFVMFLLFLCTT